MELKYINRDLHEKLFPIDGIFLGITSSSNYTSSNEFISSSGISYIKADDCNLFSKMAIADPMNIPSNWKDLGFNDSMTYADAKDILAKLGFIVKESLNMIKGFNVIITGESDNRFITINIYFHSDAKYFPGREPSAYKLTKIDVDSKDVTDVKINQLRSLEEKRIEEEQKRKAEAEAERKRQLEEFYQRMKLEELKRTGVYKFEEINRIFRLRVNKVFSLYKVEAKRINVNLSSYNIKEHLLEASDASNLKCLLSFATRGVSAINIEEIEIESPIINYESLIKLVCTLGLTWTKVNEDFITSICNSCESQYLSDFALTMLSTYEKNRSKIVNKFDKYKNVNSVKSRIIQAWFSMFEQLYIEFIGKKNFAKIYLSPLTNYSKLVQKKEYEAKMRLWKDEKEKENTILDEYEKRIKQEIDSIKANEAKEKERIANLEKELSACEYELKRWNVNFYLLGESEAARLTNIILDIARSKGISVFGRKGAAKYLKSFIQELQLKISTLKKRIEISKSDYIGLLARNQEDIDIYSEELQFISAQRINIKPADKIFNIVKFKDANKRTTNTEFIKYKFLNANYAQDEKLNRIKLFINRMACDEYSVYLFAINNSKGESRREFFDKCVLEQIIDVYMSNNRENFPDGDDRNAILKVLYEYYTKDWMFKVSINVLEKLSHKYPYLKDNVLLYRYNKTFTLNWDNVSFYNGYMIIKNFENAEYIKFHEFEYRNSDIQCGFSVWSYSFSSILPIVKCSVKDMVLVLDKVLLDECIQKIKSKIIHEHEISKQNNNRGMWGGGGWPEKYGDEYVDEYHRRGHWRRCHSGKVVWVRECDVSSHIRRYR